MSTSNGTSAVATSEGKVVQLPALQVAAERIYSFVEINRKAYFEDHSLDYCLEEIITRGMAEITRQVKTAAKLREDKAAGAVMRQFNATPAEAAKLLATLRAQANGQASPAQQAK